MSHFTAWYIDIIISVLTTDRILNRRNLQLIENSKLPRLPGARIGACSTDSVCVGNAQTRIAGRHHVRDRLQYCSGSFPIAEKSNM